MKYRFTSLKKILDIFAWNKELWATEISQISWKSRVLVHKYLKELISQWKLKKVWKWPKVKYVLTEKNFEDSIWKSCKLEVFEPDYKVTKILDNSFYKFSADWRIFKWFAWLKEWCNLRDLDIEEKTTNYIKVHKYIESIQNECWLLDATNIFWNHFKEVHLNNVFYADQYKWMEFWRWKLAEMTFYAKQSQNKKLIWESIWEIILKLKCIIKKNNYDAIAITPWSIDRKNQLLGILQDELKQFNLPFVNIIKYYPNNIPIPQKSLKSREQRIMNARNTIFIDDANAYTWKYKKVFLIDDFVWSGSTLNETASKLKADWIKQVDWFAFVWNMNLEYEVINEV